MDKNLSVRPGARDHRLRPENSDEMKHFGMEFGLFEFMWIKRNNDVNNRLLRNENTIKLTGHDKSLAHKIVHVKELRNDVIEITSSESRY